jgi:hypothetical protein
MDVSREMMLEANLLIHQHGDGAEEHVAKQLWDSRQADDKKAGERWLQMRDALKRVRQLRKEVEGTHGRAGQRPKKDK